MDQRLANLTTRLQGWVKQRHALTERIRDDMATVETLDGLIEMALDQYILAREQVRRNNGVG